MNNSTNHTELRKLAEAATPGPWRVVIDDTGDRITGGFPSICASKELDLMLIHWNGFKQEFGGDLPERKCVANANFIAAANPQAIIALLDERDALRELVSEFAKYICVYDNESSDDSSILVKLKHLRAAKKLSEQS